MNNTLNTVKAGATVPMKFEVFKAETEVTDPSLVTLASRQVSCDAIETTTSGSTGLRYDETASQFVYNWKAPKATGSCYAVTATTADGSSTEAFFKLR